MQGFYPSNLNQIFQGIIPYAYGTQDPSVTATPGTQGQLFLRLPTGILYRKNDNGETTNWSLFSLPSAITVNGITPVDNITFTNLNVAPSGPMAVNVTANVTAVSVGTGQSIINSTSGLTTTYKTIGVVPQRYILIGGDANNITLDHDIENAPPYDPTTYSIFEALAAFKGTNDGIERFGTILELDPNTNPYKYSVIFEDFYNASTSLGGGLTGTQSGAGANSTGVQSPVDITEVGVCRSTTGSTATGRAAIFNSGNAIRLGNNRILYSQRSRVAGPLSDPTDRFIIRAGLMNAVTGGATEPTRGIYFRYTDNENSGRWVCVCRNANIETVINTAVPKSNSVYQNIYFIYRFGLGVDFYINGVFQGTITTNIPTGVGNEVGVCSNYIAKTLGTNARNSDCDFVFTIYELVSQTRG